MRARMAGSDKSPKHHRPTKSELSLFVGICGNLQLCQVFSAGWSCCAGKFLLHTCAVFLYCVAEPSRRSPPVMAFFILATTTVGRSLSRFFTPATLPLFDGSMRRRAFFT